MIPNAIPKMSRVTPMPAPTSWVVVNFSLLHFRNSLAVSGGLVGGKTTYPTELSYSQLVGVDDVSGAVRVMGVLSVESDMISIEVQYVIRVSWRCRELGIYWYW